jgi:drug/metabolite transporter (DMT)-like permease
VLAVARREPIPSPTDLAWCGAAAVFGAIGILGLYRGLAAGRMGVVAPVTGVLGATVPVLVGILLDGLPSLVVLAGIVLALVAVVLVSRAAHDGDERRPPGLEFALVGGFGIGLFNVTISRISDGLVFGPLTVVRGVGALVLVLALVIGGGGSRLARGLLPVVVAVGLLDMTGNAFFLLAAQAGPLAVAAVLSSLYPVTTVLLATFVLRERLTRGHAVGVASAVVAIALIASGSA